MSNDLTKRLYSQDPADAAWRLEAARVDAAIEGIQEYPELRAFREELGRLGLTTDEKAARIADRFFPLQAD